MQGALRSVAGACRRRRWNAAYALTALSVCPFTSALPTLTRQCPVVRNAPPGPGSNSFTARPPLPS